MCVQNSLCWVIFFLVLGLFFWGKRILFCVLGLFACFVLFHLLLMWRNTLKFLKLFFYDYMSIKDNMALPVTSAELRFPSM